MASVAVGHPALSRRARERTDPELATILAGPPPGVLAFTGGFPDRATFASDVIAEIAARLVRDDPGVALQYAPSTGVPSLRAYLLDRQEDQQGRRPAPAELLVTSGGMECLDLVGHALLDDGDDVAVEGPTYLGALIAFRGHGARLTALECDADGLDVDALEARLRDGYRPKLLYVIPDFQNPSGRTLPLGRREALVELCRRHAIVLLEDVAYRETTYDGTNLPSLWSLAPDVVVQAGTFSKVFAPGVRLGWAAGPAELIDAMGAAKQTTDQCAGALGQRMVEEYGRAGHFGAQLPQARALYAGRWAAMRATLEAHMPPGVGWSEPSGGFFTWMTLPEGIDTLALRDTAVAAGVAFVPGTPFHPDGGGHRELRLAFSQVGEADIERGVRLLAGVIAEAMG